MFTAVSLSHDDLNSNFIRRMKLTWQLYHSAESVECEDLEIINCINRDDLKRLAYYTVN